MDKLKKEKTYTTDILNKKLNESKKELLEEKSKMKQFKDCILNLRNLNMNYHNVLMKYRDSDESSKIYPNTNMCEKMEKNLVSIENEYINPSK